MHYKSFKIFHCFLPKRISQLCGWCGTGSTLSLVKQTDCDTLLFRHLSSLAERTGHYTGLFLWYHWKTMYFYWDIKLCHYLRIAKFCYPKKITQISWDHEKKHSKITQYIKELETHPLCKLSGAKMKIGEHQQLNFLQFSSSELSRNNVISQSGLLFKAATQIYFLILLGLEF